MSSMPDKPEINYKYCMCAIKLRSLKFQVTISQPYNKESIGKLFLVCVCTVDIQIQIGIEIRNGL